MSKIEERYGCALRIYDNGGATFDRFTCVPPRWAHQYRGRNRWQFEAIGSSERPFYPQGFGQHVTTTPGPHLGKRIHWNDLPPDVQKFARQAFPEFCPPTRTAYLKRGGLEKLTKGRASVRRVWIVVDEDNKDVFQPWFDKKAEARQLCKENCIRLIEETT